MRKIMLLVLALLVAGFSFTPVYADGADSSSRSSKLAPFQKLIEDKQFQQAISKLDQALSDTPDDPDLLNLLAYSHRNLNHFDIALKHYQQALQIEPDHRGANEYLGELYLQLDQLGKAEERLAVLDKDCFFGCDEFDDLEQAIEDYRKQHPS